MKDKKKVSVKATWDLVSRSIQAANHKQKDRNCQVTPLPSLEEEKLAQDYSAVLVEVEGGIVQEVSLLGKSEKPIKVIVRDYDNYNDAPDEYQDADWFLPVKKGA